MKQLYVLLFVALIISSATTPKNIRSIEETVADMEFVWIDPGTFMMGTPEEQEQLLRNKGLWDVWFRSEQPAHEVTISKGFYFGKYEITQGQWEAVMGSNQSYFEGANRPVEGVSWHDVQVFITKLNLAAGDSLYRLPTEAEWEYACRAGTTTLWSFGDDENQLTNYAWYEGNSPNGTKEVGQRLPNSWGLYDMHGNVEEWCQEWYRNYSSDAQTNPNFEFCRVTRGGSFFNSALLVRSARHPGAHGTREVSLGLRLLRTK